MNNTNNNLQTSSSSTTTPQTATQNQAAPIDEVSKAIMNLSMYAPGTYRIIDDSDKTPVNDNVGRVSPFKWLLIKLPNHTLDGAQGLLVLSLKIALYKKRLIFNNWQYSVEITKPTETHERRHDDYTNDSINASESIADRTLLNGKICDVPPLKEENWATYAAGALCNQLCFTKEEMMCREEAQNSKNLLALVIKRIKENMINKGVTRIDSDLTSEEVSEEVYKEFYLGKTSFSEFKNLKEKANRAFGDKLSRLDLISYIPIEVCDSVANAIEMMRQNGLIIRNQSAKKELEDIERAPTHAAENTFRTSGLHMLKLSHTIVIGKIPNANNGQSSTHIDTIRVTPIKISENETLMVTMTNIGYGINVPNKTETIKQHVENLNIAITALQTAEGLMKVKSIIADLPGDFSNFFN